jgi:hypothetical protein
MATKKAPTSAPSAPDVDSEEVTDPAIVKFKVPADAPPPASGPANIVVVGAAAQDPLVRAPEGPSKLALQTWALAKRLRPVDLAGFIVWARSNAPSECIASEWAAHLARYNATPVL